MDFTFLVATEGFALTVPRQTEEENRLFAFIGPFQPLVIYNIYLLSYYTNYKVASVAWGNFEQKWGNIEQLCKLIN